MTRIIASIVLLLTLPVCLYGQKKELAEAKTYIKSGSNCEKAEQIILALTKKDSTLARRPQVLQLWFTAIKKQYEKGNEKLYLKQKYDTAALFDCTMRMLHAAAHIDSVEMQLQAEGGPRPKLRKRNAAEMIPLLPNIYAGGVFHQLKKDYKAAFGYYNDYLTADSLPLFVGSKLDTPDSMRVKAAVAATYCGYREGNADHTLRHADTALRDSTVRNHTLRYVGEAYLLRQDTATYLKTLGQGFAEYPKSPYFFPRLIDDLKAHGRLDDALRLADAALETDSTAVLFQFAKTMILLDLRRYDECLTLCKQIIARTDTLAEVYFNAASACLNQAHDIELSKAARSQKARLTALYVAAMPYMERYRELAPSRQDRWAPALYRIYLALSYGKKFDEIDRLLEQAQ